MFAYLWLFFFLLYHPSAPPTFSRSHYICYFNRFFLRFTSFFPTPPSSATPSLSFPQEEPQSYLGYVGFGELKSHFTNSLSVSPENSTGYLKQFHHPPGFVCWNAANRATFYSLSPLSADPLPGSPSSGASPLLFFSFCFFSVPALTKMLDIHILGFFGDVKEC